MRRPSFYVLTSVSLAALMTVATVTEAMQPAVQMLGVLKPKEQWKVGTVDASGAPYCAMVGKFDQASTLAFARSPEGFGSLGIEFHDDLFKTGKKYEVSLTLENLAPRTFSGEASTARSLVLQIGEDDALYDSLNRSETLRVTTSAIDVRFGISKFQPSYKKLLTCANVLAGPQEQVELPPDEMAKADLPAGQGQLLAPIRNILQKLKGKPAETEAAAAEKAAAPLQYAEKDIVWNDEKQAAAKTAAADKKKSGDEVSLPLPKPSARLAAAVKAETQTADTATPEVVNLPQERKLLASMAVTGHAVTAESVGMDAREMEKIQAAKLERDMARKQQEIAALAAQTTHAARQQVEESTARQDAMLMQAKDLQKQIAALEKAAAVSAQAVAKTAEGPAVAAAPVTGVAAEQVAEPQKVAEARAAKQLAAQAAKLRAEELALKQAEMEKLNAAREAEARQLAETLSKTEADFNARVVAIEAERDGLKKQLEQALLFNSAVEPALETAKREGALKIRALETRLDDAEQARGLLREQLAKAEESNKALQESLKAQQEERLRADEAVKQIAALQTALEKQARETQALELALAAEKAKPPVKVEVPVEVAVEVPAKPDPKLAEEKMRLESRLSSVEAERKAEATRLAKLEEERKAEAERLAKLEEERKAEAERLAKLEQAREAETRRAAALKAERDAARQQAEQEIRALREEKAALEKKLAARNAVAAAQAPARQVQPLETRMVGTVQAVPPAPVTKSAKLAAIETAAGNGGEMDLFPAPVVSQRMPASATPRQVTAQVSSGGNRAEAFLDSIMQHHRPQGAAKPAAKAPVPQKPVKAMPYRAVPAPVSAAPAATAPAVASPVKPADVSLKPAVAPAMRNVPIEAPKKSARAVTLESLLEQSGVRGAVFEPVQQTGGEISRQWAVGRLSGLYEQMPANSQPFSVLAQEYIARYHEDCPSRLSVNLGQAEQTPAGLVAAGTLSCSMEGNSYDTSIVFVQSGAQFAALLHSGNPSDAAQVKSVGDNILYTLSSSAGLSPLPSMESAAPSLGSAAPVPAAIPVQRTVMSPEPPSSVQPRFNIGSAPAAASDEFETVVIQ